MNKKTTIITLVLILILLIFGFFIFRSRSETTDNSKATANNPTVLQRDEKEPNFLLDGFPIDKVPLYKMDKISSSKIFVNTDPKNISEFNETKFAYFNVVLETNASKEEFLNYYKKLFESPITDEYENENMVKGKIGEYKVSAAHYESGNNGYIQVHLPDYADESLNEYYMDFPKIIEANEGLVEHEKSYGLLNQSGGQTEYTKYFTVIDSGDKNNDGKDDVDEFLVLETKYKNQFQEKTEYSYDEKTGTMKWQDGGYDSTLSISRDHGRIYLMLRKGLDK